MLMWHAGKDGDLSDDLPPHEYYDLFKLDNQLHIPTDPDLENENPRHYLDQVSGISMNQAVAELSNEHRRHGWKSSNRRTAEHTC